MRTEPTILLVCVLVSVCTVGKAARKICTGKDPECQSTGHVSGVRDRHRTVGDTNYRIYFCDGSKTLNIPVNEKFECCYYVFEDRYKWRKLNDIGFYAVNTSLKCEAKVECERPPAPVAHMQRTDAKRYMTQGGRNYYDGDRLVYKCEDGFEQISGDEEPEIESFYYDGPPKMIPTSSITCTSAGQWMDTESKRGDINLGICQAILCDATRFAHVINGKISNYKTVYKYGEYLELICDDGYVAKNGIQVIRCETSTSFSNIQLSDFRCQVIRCPPPPHIEHGGAFGLNRSINGTVTFGCDNGYTLSGQKTWRCNENGEWDSYCVRCNRKDTYCQAPCVPKGAKLRNPMLTYPEGAVIHFDCNIHGGSSERVCLRNRQWSGDDIDCTGQTSGVPRLLNALDFVAELGKKAVGNITVAGKTIDVNQAEGVDVYMLVDISGSISKTQFNDTKNFINVLLPRLNINTAQTGTSLALYMFGSEVHEIWNDHFNNDRPKSTDDWLEEVNGLKQRDLWEKTKNGTAFANALYKIKSNIQEKEIKWTKPESTLRIAQQVLIIISDGLHNMGGDPMKLSRELRDNHSVEIFSICVQPERRQRGWGISFMKNLASYEEKDSHFYLLATDSGHGDWNSIIDAMIRGGPDCSDCGCTLPERTQYKNATNQYHFDAIPNAWPWMAQLRKKNGGHLCGGSIIDNQWILTAAHCVAGGVHSIDLKRLKLDNDNDVINIPIRNANVHIYNKYDENRNQRFRYDIALIYLGRGKAITFNDEVHAVCLGDPNDSTYYKYLESGRFGVVTGWGKKGPDAPYSNHLKQMQMTIQTNATCFKMDDTYEIGRLASKKYHPSMMFCAGGKDDRDNVIDTCEGDSGGTFVVPYDDDVPDKTNRFMQIGIVSNGIGRCMTGGSYGIYTRLTPELLKWIYNTTGIPIKRRKGDNGKREGLNGSDGKREGLNGSDGKREGLNGSDGKREGLNGSDGKREGLNGSDGKREGLNGSDGKRAGLNGSDGKREGLNGSDGKRAGLNGSDGKRAGLNGSDGKREGLNGSDGKRAGLNGSDGKRAGLNGSDGKRERLNGSDGKRERLNGSDGKRERLNGSDGKRERLNGSDGKREGLNGSDGKCEGLNGCDGKREGLNGSNGKPVGLKRSNGTSEVDDTVNQASYLDNNLSMILAFSTFLVCQCRFVIWVYDS